MNATTASEKQISFIKDLLYQVESIGEAQRQDAFSQIDSLTKESASNWISKLLDLKKQNKDTGRRPQPSYSGDSQTGDPEAGMYRADGEIFRVYLGQQSGRMLVKRLVESGGEYNYEYVGAAAYKLPKDATALPLEEAKKFGRMTGTCCVCARRLDDPESVDAGIGPVCAKRFS